MTSEIVIRYIHFLSIFFVVGALFTEAVLIKKEMSSKEINLLSKIDSIYGLAAIILVATGLSLWFWVGKPADFYTKNWIFHTKVGLAILMGILSIFPTIYFLKNRKSTDGVSLKKTPGYIFWTLRLELVIIIVIPFLAVLMAKGVGYY